jgi:photosystem II stability/assembly factor-like uncharacterized protein
MWMNQPNHSASALQGIFGASDGKSLWAAGADGTILVTQNSGMEWQSVETPSKVKLEGIYGTPGGMQLWAVGEKGTIVESKDGGHSWLLVKSPIPADLNAVYSDASGRNVVAVGANGVIVKRRDDGTWSAIPSGQNKSLFAIRGSADGRVLFAAGGGGVVLVSEGSDAGEHWTAEPVGAVHALHSLFSDADGHRAWAGDEDGEVFIRTRPGVWESHQTPIKKYLVAIHGTPDGSMLWIAGGRGTLMSSTDSGSDWTMLRPRPFMQITSIATSTDGRGIFGLASEGKLIASADGGENWDVRPVDDSGSLKALFVSQNGTRIFAAGDHGKIARSQDGGRRWTSTTLGGDEYRALIGTPDGNTLWVGGEGGVLQKSTDGGQNWNPLDIGTGNTVLGFSRSADGKLWATAALGVNVGSASEILVSKDDGQKWTIKRSEPSLDLRSIFVTRDGREIWAVGSGGSVVSSSDGGESWETRRVTQADLFYVTGDPDAQQLWAVGGKGTIIRYDRDNHDWTVQPQRTTDDLTGVFFTPGGQLWAAGQNGAILRTFPAQSLPVGLTARLVSEPSRGAVVEFEPDWKDKPRIYLNTVRVYAGSPPAEDRYSLIPGPALPPTGHSKRWQFQKFDPKKMLNVNPGESLQIKIELGTEATRRAYILPPFTYDPWHWFRENWIALSSVGVAAGVIVLLETLLLLRPLWLLTVYRHAFVYEAVEKVSLPGLKTILKATVLPYFVQHERTLDAWVAAHLELLRSRFEKEPAVGASQGYVPLPMRLGDSVNGELIDKPTSELLSTWWVKNARMLMDIVGPGGAGKTMMAVQIGRWALDGRLSGHPMIPLIVDEETTDSVGFARKKLAAWLSGEDQLPDIILSALLRRKRLLLIFDRLSERSLVMRQHVRALHGSFAVNAVVVTARYLTKFWVEGERRLFPQPLDSSTLLYFVQTLLTRGVFATAQEQIDLGQRIVSMIRVGGKEMPLTPLLVRLYVTKAMTLAGRGASLDELPRSIPEAYFDYLRSVNPEAPSLLHGMHPKEMLRSAELIAEMTLRDDLVPKEVLRSEVRKRLLESGWPNPAMLDPVERLMINGVLVEKEAGTDSLIRFILDPVAEYLGGMAMAKECGTDAARWRGLLETVRLNRDQAAGFRNALLVLVQTYGKQFGWPVVVSGEGEFGFA